MRVSLRWLQDYVDLALPPPELAHRLTMSGTAVGAIETIGEAWDGIVVGQITGLERHPNADRLWLATVEIGKGPVTVVTGAPNLRVGVKVPYAPVGSRLFNPKSGQIEELRPAKIRGMVSAGMVCSEAELRLSDDHEGIMILPGDAPVGTPLTEYLGDTIFDLEITANRPDCLSMLGVAREVGALTSRRVRRPAPVYPEHGQPAAEAVAVEIADPDLCRRYTATLIRGVKIRPSPEWLQQRLRAAGMRPINNVVDVTNYVMLEFGQPLHAFDYEKLAGRRIIVRRARAGETITTLDGAHRELWPEALVIADAERPVAIAGVMGGAESEVSETTTTILLESANFSNVSIRRTSARLKLRSEASSRFEKGLSPELTEPAARRATQLFVELAGGEAAPGVVDVYPGQFPRQAIELSTAEARRILGADLSAGRIADVLRRLEFEVTPVVAPGSPLPMESEAVATAVLALPPADRVDVTITDDVIEEVARIIGYDELPATMLSGEIPRLTEDPELTLVDQFRNLLVGAGLQEVITYSLVSWTALERVHGGEELRRLNPIKLWNPMTTEQEYLRTTMRASLLMALAANARQWDDPIKLFEVGRIYLPRPQGQPDERRVLCGIIAGPRWPRTWTTKSEPVDFYDARGPVETALTRLGLAATFRPAGLEGGRDANLHPGKSAEVAVDGRRVGLVGAIRPDLLEAFDVPLREAYLFELDLPALLAVRPQPRRFQPIPRYPGVERDLAVVVEQATPAERVQAILAEPPLVRRVRLFDVYTGQPLPADKKSLAYSLLYQAPDRTLTDREVDRVQEGLIARLRDELGATIRG